MLPYPRSSMIITTTSGRDGDCAIGTENGRTASAQARQSVRIESPTAASLIGARRVSLAVQRIRTIPDRLFEWRIVDWRKSFSARYCRLDPAASTWLAKWGRTPTTIGRLESGAVAEAVIVGGLGTGGAKRGSRVEAPPESASTLAPFGGPHRGQTASAGSEPRRAATSMVATRTAFSGCTPVSEPLACSGRTLVSGGLAQREIRDAANQLVAMNGLGQNDLKSR